MDDNERNVFITLIVAVFLAFGIPICLSFNNDYQAMKMGYEQRLDPTKRGMIWVKSTTGKETKVVEEQ